MVHYLLNPLPIWQTSPFGSLLVSCSYYLYVTHLDSSCKAVLGYSFLSRYNPLIDWASQNITFHNTSHFDSPQTSVPSATNTVDAKVAVLLPEPLPSVLLTILETPPGNSLHSCSRSHSRMLWAKPLSSKFPFEPIYSYPTVSQFAAQLETPEVDIALVSAAVFNRACKDAGMEPILLCAIHSEVAARTADHSSTAPIVPPLPHSIPAEYAEFADIFDEIAADTLPEHRPYDLKIDLEEGALLPLG
ncbi:hypothetical protein HHX47_DHR2000551 [Lentinula edodes]|nr:hypothetical protein HHX47_DHR2000551 [Lentinula edodes]